MAQVLFLNQPTVGHLNTLLSIASQMKEDGHDVSFLVPGIAGAGPPVQALEAASLVPNLIRKSEIEVHLVRPPLAMAASAILLRRATGYDETCRAVAMFFKGIEYYARTILRFIEANRPDVLVADFAFPAAGIAAEVAGIPYVAVYHSGLPFRGEGIPPFGSGLPIGTDRARWGEYAQREERLLRSLDRLVNRARGAFGLPPGAPDVLRRPISPWLNLVTSVEAAEAPRNNVTANTLYVGPCFARRKGVQTEFPFDQLCADRFKVYASLGTVFNNRPQVFQKIMHALDTPEYQVIVSAGGSYQALLQGPLPQNVMLFKSVPQVELLPLVDLVIGHGGNNSTNETLAAGKPLVILPVGGEQTDNARRVEYLGVGRSLEIDRFTPQQLWEIVGRIREDGACQERVRVIMVAVGVTRGPWTASRCIDWVARNRAPLYRPAGLSLTVNPGDLSKLFKLDDRGENS